MLRVCSFSKPLKERGPKMQSLGQLLKPWAMRKALNMTKYGIKRIRTIEMSVLIQSFRVHLVSS